MSTPRTTFLRLHTTEDRAFLRIMKPIFAAQTANVKVNEGFWWRARALEIYPANFTVKFPLRRNGKWDRSRVLRPTCPLSPLYTQCGFLDFLPDLSSRSPPLISALFNAILFSRVSKPLLRRHLTYSPLLFCHSGKEGGRAICRIILREEQNLFRIFNCGFTVREKSYSWFIDPSRVRAR